jgi:hypothetical protein
MPPEEVASLIAVDFALEDGKLVGQGERIYPTQGPVVLASWYANAQPQGYRSVCGGLVYVHDPAGPIGRDDKKEGGSRQDMMSPGLKSCV